MKQLVKPLRKQLAQNSRHWCWWKWIVFHLIRVSFSWWVHRLSAWFLSTLVIQFSASWSLWDDSSQWTVSSIKVIIIYLIRNWIGLITCMSSTQILSITHSTFISSRESRCRWTGQSCTITSANGRCKGQWGCLRTRGKLRLDKSKSLVIIVWQAIFSNLPILNCN